MLSQCQPGPGQPVRLLSLPWQPWKLVVRAQALPAGVLIAGGGGALAAGISVRLGSRPVDVQGWVGGHQEHRKLEKE